MEFPFQISQILPIDENNFSFIDSNQELSSLRISSDFAMIINKMGEASSVSQSLPSIITSASKFFDSGHKIFFKIDDNKVLGFIKVGYKKLFLRDRNNNVHEVNPLCVLDFYVHESTQRKGIGKLLFDYMLKNESITPKRLAYDRPSNKLLCFLKKHFNLVNYVTQNNNYVVFDEFFLNQNECNDKVYDFETGRLLKSMSPYYKNNNAFGSGTKKKINRKNLINDENFKNNLA